MYLLRRIAYYLISLWTLTRGIRNRRALFALLRPYAGPVILTLADGTRFAVRGLMDVWIIKETNLDRDYERNGAPIGDSWTVVDIGAGLGDFTVFAARRALRGRVYAYEPARDSAALLRQNLALNGITNVEAYELAVSHYPGELSLDTSSGVAVQYRTAGIMSDDGSATRVHVRCVALAEVLASLPDGGCDYLKIDVEGAEYDMLLNLEESSLQRVRRICLEYHEGVTQHSHLDLERFFVASGWRVQVRPSLVKPDLGFLYAERMTMPTI